jgi:uncharacterized protein (TIGR03663 family)
MRRLRTNRVPAALLAVTAFALAVRLWALGRRTAHVDEARLAVLTLEVTAAGAYQYVPFLQGPLLLHLQRFSFWLLGPSDLSMRLPVALVGGLLPLAAWLFRSRLRDSEVVALAGLLALNPLLVYYSRFGRSDVLLAALALATVGFAVRLLDTRRPAYLYAATGTVALALATKANVALYVAVWLGALALEGDFRLFTAVVRGADWRSEVADALDEAREGVTDWWTHLVAAAGGGVALVALLYAPRPDLWRALGNPSAIPDVLAAGTVDVASAFYGYWVEAPGPHFVTYHPMELVQQPVLRHHPFLSYLTAFAETLVAGGLVVVGVGVLGFLSDRYTAGGPRPLVAVATYAGVASAVLYPIVLGTPNWVAMRDTMDAWTELFLGAHPLSTVHTVAPWSGVHVTVALAIPAAVGVAAVYRYGRRAARDGERDVVRAAASALVVLLLVGYAGAATYDTSFAAPQDETALVQYGQPTDDLSPLLAHATAADTGDGTDVVLYGARLTDPQYQRPLRWYFQSAGVEYESSHNTVPLREGDPPPVVVTATSESIGQGNPDDVTRAHSGYERAGTYTTRLPLEHRTLRLVVFVDEDR